MRGTAMSEQAQTGQSVFDLFDAVATAVVAVDEHATIRYVNVRAGEVFGYATEELLGRSIELLVPQTTAGDHVAQRDAYLLSPTPRPFGARRDLKGRRKDGTEFEADISVTPLGTPSGLWVVASILDISLQREAEARVQQQSRSYLALARLNEAVARAEDETVLFRRVCNVAVIDGGFIGAWVAMRGAGGSLQVQASAGPLAARVAVAGMVDPEAMSALTSGIPSFTDDFSAHGQQHADRVASLGVGSAAALPLRSHNRTVASLSLYSDRPGAFDDNLRTLLLGAAENISLALDRFEANADLDRALVQRLDLVRRLVDAQERERARIAADVHDEPVQALAAMDLRLALLERKLAQAAPDLVPEVVHIHETITSVNEGLRNLLFELEPVGPSAYLTDLLEDAAGHVFELTTVAWTMENEPDPRELELSVAIRTQAVRIAKEALVNVAKHARARSVRILVKLDDEGVTLQVSDDGIGIPPGVRSSPPGHRGISGMLDRAEVAGGALSVDSEGNGTTISVWLPRV
jgi:PAS domain S-box-containing protein